MTVLENKRLYLSSPIEYCQDSSWQTCVKNTLINDFKLKVFDPRDDPKQEEALQIHPLKEAEDYPSLRKIAKSFVRKDLAVVDRADIVLAFVPHKVPTTGCCHEIINSNNAKKPTLLVEGTSKSKISTWYFGFIPDHFMFGKWEELFEFLKAINNGEYEHDDRLFFLYNYPKTWLS